MKNYLFYVLLAILFLPSCSSKKSGEISVKLDLNEEIGDTILALLDQNGFLFTGKSGKFDFTLPVEEIQWMTLTNSAKSDYLTLPIVPGESVLISGEFPNQIVYSGSKFYQDFDVIQKSGDAARKEFTDFIADLNKRMDEGENIDSLQSIFEKNREALSKKVDNNLKEVIKNNADKEAAACLISMFTNINSMKEGYELLSDDVKNGRMKVLAERPFKADEDGKKEEEAAAKKQAAGTPAPDFTLNDINGKPLSLSSLRGQYVLLDFWGSWCVWCIRGIPQMKEYYQKYSGKFEILGIDCNDSESKWKEAVAEYELPWLHVYNPEGVASSNPSIIRSH